MNSTCFTVRAFFLESVKGDESHDPEIEAHEAICPECSLWFTQHAVSEITGETAPIDPTKPQAALARAKAKAITDF